MNIYVKPKCYFLQNYLLPVHMQGSGAPIIPDCQQEGTMCAAANLGYSCTNGSDWLIFFELGNTDCEETPNPLIDLNCQIIDSTFGNQVVLQGCTLQAACSETGCEGGAVYQVLCEDTANEGDCGFNDVISVSCSIGGIENCNNNNPI